MQGFWHNKYKRKIEDLEKTLNEQRELLSKHLKTINEQKEELYIKKIEDVKREIKSEPYFLKYCPVNDTYDVYEYKLQFWPSFFSTDTSTPFKGSLHLFSAPTKKKAKEKLKAYLEDPLKFDAKGNQIKTK